MFLLGKLTVSRIRQQILRHLGVELGDDHGMDQRRGPGDDVRADADGGLDVGHQPVEEHQAVPAQPVGQAHFQQVHLRALDARIGGSDGRGDGAGLDDAERIDRLRAPLCREGIDDVRVHTGQVDVIEHRACADRQPRGQRFLDVSHGPGDQHQVLAVVHRARDDTGDRRLFCHRIPGVDAGGDGVEFDEGERWVHGYLGVGLLGCLLVSLLVC